MAAVTDAGKVYTWGSGSLGQLGLGSMGKSDWISPTLVPLDTPMESVHCGDFFTALLCSELC